MREIPRNSYTPWSLKFNFYLLLSSAVLQSFSVLFSLTDVALCRFSIGSTLSHTSLLFLRTAAGLRLLLPNFPFRFNSNASSWISGTAWSPRPLLSAWVFVNLWTAVFKPNCRYALTVLTKESWFIKISPVYIKCTTDSSISFDKSPMFKVSVSFEMFRVKFSAQQLFSTIRWTLTSAPTDVINFKSQESPDFWRKYMFAIVLVTCCSTKRPMASSSLRNKQTYAKWRESGYMCIETLQPDPVRPCQFHLMFLIGDYLRIKAFQLQSNADHPLTHSMV